MSTVHLISPEEAPLAVRAFFAQGQPGPLVASLAHVPDLLQATMPFVGRVLGASWIDARIKEIVILRASSLLGCRYCVATHTVVAMDAGLTRPEMDALRESADAAEVFESPREQALVRWTDAVAQGRGPVGADVTEAFKAHFEDAEVVELTLLVGVTMTLNRYATSLAFPIPTPCLETLRAEGFDV